jgi:hypothetical protein
MRELGEEAGLAFDAARFVELGRFDYRRDKACTCTRSRWATTCPTSATWNAAASSRTT